MTEENEEGDAPNAPADQDADAPTRRLDRPAGEGRKASGGKPGKAGSSPPRTSGKKVGAYTLVEKLGEGGFGEVWRARQEEPVRREVALKILKASVASSGDMIVRFQAESQALAMMDHPNVAKVYDAGELGDGRFFFAMALVGRPRGDGSVEPGMALTDFCDTEKIGLKGRLELFAQVCRAIHHAHQRGVIHRDIKPSNILVGESDGKPVPKVIDFGIAKDSGGDLLEETLYTETGQLIGTPQYMSPEQASGKPGAVDTRTDVYALGAVLYELLCGEPPISRETLKKASLEELLRRIREEDPPRPSARAGATEIPLETASARGHSETRRLAEALRGEPDWITLKAMEKEPGRRHQSAGELAEDAEAFVGGAPLPHSGPPSRRYRIKKFVHRNRGVVASAAAIMVLLVAGTAASLWQASRARSAEAEAVGNLALAERREGEATEAKKGAEKARDEQARLKEEAEKAREEAEAVSQFLVDAFRSPDPSVDGRKITVASVLERAWGLLKKEKGLNPRREAALSHALAQTFIGLGLPKESIPVLESLVELREATDGGENLNTLIAKKNLAAAYSEVGRFEEALRIYESVVESMTRTRGENSGDTLSARLGLANIYWELDRAEAALEMREELLVKIRTRSGKDDEDALRALSHLAVSYRDAGRIEEALKLMEEGLEILTKKFGGEHPSTLTSMLNLGVAYADAGRPEEAVAMLEKAYKLGLEVLGGEHPTTMHASYNLANIYWRAGRGAEALKMREQVLEARRRVLGELHPGTLMSTNNLAVSYRDAGRVDDALELVEDVVPKMKRVMGTKNWDVLATMGNLARWLNDAKRAKEALAAGTDAVDAMEKALGAEDPMTLSTKVNLAESYWRLGRLPEAVALAEPALEALRRVEPGGRNTRMAMSDLASIYNAMGRLEDTVKLRREVLEFNLKRYEKTHVPLLGDMTDFGSLLKRAGKVDEAIEILEESAALKRKVLPPGHRFLWVALYHLEDCYRLKGRDEDAAKIRAEIKALPKAGN